MRCWWQQQQIKVIGAVQMPLKAVKAVAVPPWATHRVPCLLGPAQFSHPRPLADIAGPASQAGLQCSSCCRGAQVNGRPGCRQAGSGQLHPWLCPCCRDIKAEQAQERAQPQQSHFGWVELQLLQLLALLIRQQQCSQTLAAC